MSAVEKILIFVDDVATACRIAEATARRWIAAGRFGRPVRVGRRTAVLREDFERGLRAMRDGRPLRARTRTDDRARDCAGRYAGGDS